MGKFNFYGWEFRSQPDFDDINKILKSINERVIITEFNNVYDIGCIIHTPDMKLSEDEWNLVWAATREDDHFPDHSDKNSSHIEISLKKLKQYLVKRKEEQERGEKEEKDFFENITAKISEIFCTNKSLDGKREEVVDLVRSLEPWQKVKIWISLDIANGEGWTLDEIRILANVFEIDSVQIPIKSVKTERALRW